ncbi:MAG: glutamate formimidoyltransferase [Acidobacteria bacterium]|nr:glutamate formimidoyltransferase [Acidobacteriota bacterium]
MQQIVECVMNVSEGRDTLKLETIAQKIEAVPSAFLLDHSADPDHHRTVFSFIGTPASIFAASFAAVKKAVQLVDMREHQGVHPRIGAVDVVPFVPVQNVSMKECVTVAHRLGKKISQTLQIPVYFYAEAALRPDREHLSVIRKDQFEGLDEQIKSDPRRKPDLGPCRLHPTAGATAIGARQPLIAFNIYLNTSDVGQARKIAGLIRESGGGLAGVKALGLYIERKGLAQVSMNVTHYRKTSLLKIFKKVQKEARRLQTEPVWSEIIGLVPQDAINPRTIRTLHLENFHSGQILENRIAEVLNNASRLGGT